MNRQVFFSATSYPRDREDWRGTFILRVVEALSKLDDLDLDVWAPPGPTPHGVRRSELGHDRRWLSDLMRRGGLSHLLRTRPVLGVAKAASCLWRLRRAATERKYDIYHCNWLQTALSLPSNDTPILVTVLGNDMKLLETYSILTPWLKRLFQGRRVWVAPNSQWMEPLLRTRLGDSAMVKSIPFGVDPMWFQVQPTIPDKIIAVQRINRAKIGQLLDWGWQWFEQSGQPLHLIGPMQEHIELPKWVQFHGPKSPHELATDWFPNSRAIVSLSAHAEGRPQVLQEAMAAGIPAVCSDLPAHRDIIGDNVSGFIVRSRQDTTAALEALSSDSQHRRLAHAAREAAKRHAGTWADCANRYNSAYHQLLEREQ